MTQLALRLKRLVAESGPLTVANYMALALGHPTEGYYTGHDPLGAEGDFVTAPEVSQLFGELVGLALVQHWLDLGSPSPVLLVELGPGRGTMLADALRAARVAPAFGAAVRVHLVETSPVLRRLQTERLQHVGARWHDRLATVPTDAPMLLVANEFLDALPVRQFVRLGDVWRERVVGLDGDGDLAFGLDARAMNVDAPAPWAGGGWAPGVVVEFGPAREAVADEIAARVAAQGGLALVIDYGDAGRFTVGDTLQAVRRHKKVDPLAHPGQSDLTAHVALGSVAAAAEGAGTTVWGPLAQGTFLERLGIHQRLEKLARTASAEQLAVLASGFDRLVATEQMGELFKVIAIASTAMPVPPGFTEAERWST